MMTIFKHRWLLLMTLVLSISVIADDFPEVRDLMSEEEYRLTGMDKLTKDELMNLRIWLQVFAERDASFLSKTTDLRESDSSEEGQLVISTDIKSIIEGEFTGWTGKTKFKLANGQIWQQRARGRLKTRVNDPEVIIRKNFFGFHTMEVPILNRNVPVTRIK